MVPPTVNTNLGSLGGDNLCYLKSVTTSKAHASRVLEPLMPYDCTDLPYMFAFNPCVHNEYNAVFNRHCVEFPWPDVHLVSETYGDFIRHLYNKGKLHHFTFRRGVLAKYITRVKYLVRKHFGSFAKVPFSDEAISTYMDRLENGIVQYWPNYKLGHHTPHSVEGYLDSRASFIRSRYKQVAADYECQRITPRDKSGKMFLKFEQYDVGKIHKPARAIQFRGQKYTLNLALYLSKLDKQYFAKAKTHKDGDYIFSSKGLNSEQVAKEFVNKFSKVPDPWYIGLDAKRWDAHYSLPWLVSEHLFYLFHYGGDANLVNLLTAQIVNRFSSSHGLRYTFVARRCSGDYNTSLGNNFSHAAIELRLTKGLLADYIVDGDDGVTCVTSVDKDEYLRRATQWNWGFEFAIEEIVRDIRGVQYCQRRWCGDNAYCRMVRSPKRFLSHLYNTIRNYNGTALRRYYYNIGQSILAEYKGIPWFKKIADCFMAIGLKTNKIHRDFARIYYKEKLVSSHWPNADNHVVNTWGEYPIFHRFVTIPEKETPYYFSELV